MKKFGIIIIIFIATATIAGCSHVRRNPGRVYMPDMTYSRAYETYTVNPSTLEKTKGIHYNGLPVPGTIARGDMFPYPLKNDTTGYKLSASIKNPLDTSAIDMTEAARLYLVNCGICHGPKLDGKGPLFTSGVFPAAPKDFTSDDMKKMPEGTMFHSVTYGKNMMGSYASQLSTFQRWMVIAYIKSKQGSAAGTTMAKTDSTAKKDSTATMGKPK